MPHKKNRWNHSKLNAVGLITTLVGIASATNVISEEHAPIVTEIALMVVGPLTIIFRSWFN